MINEDCSIKICDFGLSWSFLTWAEHDEKKSIKRPKTLKAKKSSVEESKIEVKLKGSVLIPKVES